MKLTKKSDRLGTEPVKELLFKLSLPAIIGMLIQALYNVIDSIYVGHLSTDALSALSLTFPIQMILIAIGVGTGIGANSLISRLLGSGEDESANNAAEHVILLSLVYGIIVGFIGIWFSRGFLRLFSKNQVLIKLGTEYIRIIMIGSVSMFIPMIFNNIMRGEGNTLVPMLTLCIGALTNIILDPFLIFGIGFFPKLGVAGAAYATVISRIISGIFITIFLFKGDNQIKLDFSKFSYDKNILLGIYKVGFPAMLMQFLASIMIGGINWIVGPYDETAIAVAGVFFRLQSFILMPVFGLNQGYIPIVGYNYGHGNFERVKKTIKLGIITGSVFTFIGFILFRFFPDHLISIFNGSDNFLRIGKNALSKISLAFPFIGVSIVASATFQAFGKGFPSLLISLLRQIILLLPIMFFLGKIYGLDQLWLAFPISESISFVVIVIWLKKTLKFKDKKNQKRE